MINERGVSDMVITATEFKTNFGKYLAMVTEQDIFITKNGKNIAKLTNPNIDKIAILDSLVGIAKDDGGDVKAARLARQ